MPLFSSGQDQVVETQTRGSKRLLCRHLGMLDYITTHPNGRTWAGAISSYLALIHLEDENNS